MPTLPIVLLLCNLSFGGKLCLRVRDDNSKRAQDEIGKSTHMASHYIRSRRMDFGAIQVLCNADGGGGVSDFPEKSVTKV